MTRLHTLNLSENQIKSLDGLEGLLNLKTLDVSKNIITDINNCAAIKLLPALTSLDVRNNQISNHEAIIPFFSEMQNLNLVYLQGNPACRKMANYRKSLIVAMTSCCYLDERPVNEIERNLAEAFMRGGKDEEIRVRDEYAEKQRQGMKNNIEYLKQA